MGWWAGGLVGWWAGGLVGWCRVRTLATHTHIATHTHTHTRPHLNGQVNGRNFFGGSAMHLRLSSLNV